MIVDVVMSVLDEKDSSKKLTKVFRLCLKSKYEYDDLVRGLNSGLVPVFSVAKTPESYENIERNRWELKVYPSITLQFVDWRNIKGQSIYSSQLNIVMEPFTSFTPGAFFEGSVEVENKEAMKKFFSFVEKEKGSLLFAITKSSKK